jgi:sugar phosphate permease
MLTLTLILSGMSIVREGVIFLFLFYVVRGLATPIFKNYINLYTPNEIRATILSVRNLVIRISFAVFGPLLGWMTDHVSLKMSFVLAGLIYFVASGIIMWPWIRRVRT